MENAVPVSIIPFKDSQTFNVIVVEEDEGTALKAKIKKGPSNGFEMPSFKELLEEHFLHFRILQNA